MLLILNLIGTFVFGLSGAMLAVRKQLDLFGVLVLAAATALGGGMTRDILLGRAPPTTLVDWRYLSAASCAGLIVFVQYRRISRISYLVQVFDAAGLGLFTVTGTSAALDAGLGLTPVALLGMLTGVGGGALRDVLAREVPLVLRGEIYALASLLGAVIIISAASAGRLGPAAEITSASATFAVRIVSLWRGWNLPVARPHERSSAPRPPS